MRTILIFLVITGFESVFAQQLFDKNRVIVMGQVLTNVNSKPIVDHEIELVSDSTYNPYFIYSNKLFTDKDGYFYDTIYTHINKGAIKIITRDYQNIIHDTTVYFRFDWSEQNILFSDFCLPIELTSTANQAKFDFIANPNGHNEKEYHFFDKTQSNYIIDREWNFGDGNFSNEVNPIHIYDEFGLYKVKLTITLLSTPTGEIDTTETVKFINVTSREYFHMGGHVFAGNFPIDMGEAYLYKIEDNNIILIDTALFSDSLGYYLFYQLIDGEYLVKADLNPNSVLFNEFLPTYYSNHLVWQKADTIFHSATNFEYDIHMVPKTVMENGPGNVSGTINYGFDVHDKDFVPAVNIEILLLDENDNPLICCHSDEEGIFELDELPFGNYKVHAEITGKQTYPINININEDHFDITDLQFIIINSTIHGNLNAIDDTELIAFSLEPYPNPAINQVNFELDVRQPGNIEITAFDKTGRIAISNSFRAQQGINKFSVDVSNLSPGIYFLNITGSKQTVSKRIVKF
jgi:hypothetical protein